MIDPLAMASSMVVVPVAMRTASRDHHLWPLPAVGGKVATGQRHPGDVHECVGASLRRGPLVTHSGGSPR